MALPLANPRAGDPTRPADDDRQAIRTLARAASALCRGGAAGSVSRLTPNGLAAELASIWPVADWRISLDLSPDATPIERLETSVRSLSKSLSPYQWEIVGTARHWQSLFAGRFGAWIGLRLRDGAVAQKLYLEIPTEAPWIDWEASLAGQPQVRSARGAAAMMIGLDPENDGVEVYYSAGHLHRGDIAALLDRLGIRQQAAAVDKFVEDLTRRSVRFMLPSYDMGFSNAWTADGRPAAFTWYSTAVGLLGPDERVRAALLATGTKRGWEMATYASLVSGVPPRHVLVGTALAAGRPPAFTATFATTPAALLRWSDRNGEAV